MDEDVFSYATADDSVAKRWFIRLVERTTGQPALKKLYLQNQRFPRPNESFWQAAVRSLGIDVRYDASALTRMPRTGPVVFVANHPYGVLDGLVICWLVEKIRSDFVVLIHSALTRAPEVRDFVLPIDFSGTDEACANNLASRAAARSQLDRGGAVIVFPAGMVSTSPDPFGWSPAIDARWQPFVAHLIQRSKATVVPIWFDGQNSWLFQMASHLNATLRLSLIFHEVKARIGTDLRVNIGDPIAFETLNAIKGRQALADELYARTHKLAFRENAALRGGPVSAPKLGLRSMRVSRGSPTESRSR
jgi:putative hemolysin